MLDLWMVLGGSVIFGCGVGCGWMAKRPKVVNVVERVPYPQLEPRQKRDAKGHWLCKDGSPGKHKAKGAILEHARTRKAATDWGA